MMHKQVPISAIAWGAVTPLGVGQNALPSLNDEYARTQIKPDDELIRYNLKKPNCARTSLFSHSGNNDQITEATIAVALEDCLNSLDTHWPQWRHQRVGWVVGTSSGGMRSAQQVFEQQLNGQTLDESIVRSALYAAPAIWGEQRLNIQPVRQLCLLNACTSSTIALWAAQLWLSLEICDIVFVAGIDVVSPFVALGFECLRATTTTTPLPFFLQRDGLALGEGAAVMAFTRAKNCPNHLKEKGPTLLGSAVTTDAYHIVAPDPNGQWLTKAIESALFSANRDISDNVYVSAHGTATQHNDAAESKAIVSIWGATKKIPTHAFKGQIGHLLGAAGIVETLAAWWALKHNVQWANAAPETKSHGTEPGVFLAEKTVHNNPEYCVKLAAAFGGSNAVIVLTEKHQENADSAEDANDPSSTNVNQTLLTHKEGSISPEELSQYSGVPIDKTSRMDELTRLVVYAVVSAKSILGPEIVEQAALIVEHDLATVGTNAAFWSNIVKRGAAMAEPRKFPYTSPNACAGEAAMIANIHGPTMAVGGRGTMSNEANQLANDIVQGQWSNYAIVVKVHEQSEAGDAWLQAIQQPIRPSWFELWFYQIAS